MPVTAHSIPLGSRAPWFRATTLDGIEVTTESGGDSPLLVMFVCNHSPYVRHIEEHLGATVAEFQRRGLSPIAVSPNDPVAYPADAEANLRVQVARANFMFPYVLDADQKLARAFGASCTPEFFLYGDMSKGGRLVYHGEYDSTRPGHGIAPTGAPLRAAIEKTLDGGHYGDDQMLAFGCSVKWRSGRDPTFGLALGR